MSLTTRARRGLASTVAAALAAAGLIALASPSQAAPTPVATAALTWGYSGYSQQGAFGVPWAFKSPTGNATILASGNQASYRVDTQPVTSQPSNRGNYPTAARFSAGTGTVDAATGASNITWAGSFTINAYPSLPVGSAAPDETYADPELTVAADGSGTLTFEVTIGAGSDMNGDPTPSQDLGELTAATFPAGALVGNPSQGFRLTPAFQGVQVTVPSNENAQDRSCTSADKWGAWPTGFVAAMPASVRAHYYSTGCGGLNNAKPALPFDVDVDGVITDVPPVVTPPVVTPPVVAPPAPAPAVVKAATAKPTVKVSKKPTSKKKGKATVVVKPKTGNSKPTGKVKVTLTKGKTKKNVTVTLKNGKATVTLPKLKKGTWKLKAAYAGSATQLAATSKTYTVKSTK